MTTGWLAWHATRGTGTVVEVDLQSQRPWKIKYITGEEHKYSAEQLLAKLWVAPLPAKALRLGESAIDAGLLFANRKALATPDKLQGRRKRSLSRDSRRASRLTSRPSGTPACVRTCARVGHFDLCTWALAWARHRTGALMIVSLLGGRRSVINEAAPLSPHLAFPRLTKGARVEHPKHGKVSAVQVAAPPQYLRA